MESTPFVSPHIRSPTFAPLSSADAARAARAPKALAATMAFEGWFCTAAITSPTAPPSIAAFATPGCIWTSKVNAQQPSCCTSQCRSCIFIAFNSTAKPPSAATFSPPLSASAASVVVINCRSAWHPTSWILSLSAALRMGPRMWRMASGPFSLAASIAVTVSATASLLSPEVERGRARGRPIEVSRARSTGGGSDSSRPKATVGGSSWAGRLAQTADDADSSFSKFWTEATIDSPTPSGARKVSRSMALPSPGPKTAQMELTTSRTRSCQSLSCAVP
mmetsp:Transcript_7789/g.18382  ORF Transcript_7789/g.18382 Transcript_7789/m.18382 type:complete len:278 (+) Transcript_7789:582-1415(+)